METWQDLVVSGAQVVLFLALLPALRHEEKPSLMTSIPTMVALLGMVVAFYSLELWWSSGMTLLVALEWWELALQRARKIG